MSIMNNEAVKQGYQASRWLKTRLLLSALSMKELMDHLEPLCFIQAASVIKSADPCVSKDDFLAAYSDYVQHLEQDEAGCSAFAKRSSLFTLTLSTSQEIAKTYEVRPGFFLTRLSEPGVQVRPCLVDFSHLSRQFSYRALGATSISWGLEFSYPQLIQKAGGTIENGLKEPFVNGSLFKKLQKWARLQTRPAIFNFEGQKIISELRIGEDTSWAEDMPAIKKRGLTLFQSP